MRANEFTPLNELNKDTLHSYHRKADSDVAKKYNVLGPQMQAGDAPAANKTAHKIDKRLSGLDRASDRLNKDVAEGHDTEELANQVYAEFEMRYPNLARHAHERTIHAAIMDVLNYGGDNDAGALAQDVARAVKHQMEQGVDEAYKPWNSKERSPEDIARIKAHLDREKRNTVPGQLKKAEPKSKRTQYDSDKKLDYFASLEEQFCEDCGGSLAEAGKASRALCKSSRSNADLGVSQLASCKSQGLRARETPKKHTIGSKHQSIKGKMVKGHKYGGPLPYNKSDK